jgi:hypothetical protein
MNENINKPKQNVIHWRKNNSTGSTNITQEPKIFLLSLAHSLLSPYIIKTKIDTAHCRRSGKEKEKKNGRGNGKK